MIQSSDILVNIMIFLLASFLGIELIRHVSRLLHTPLMSLTNAISSVSFVAAIIVLGSSESKLITLLALLAIACASINAIGGFMITDRILKMFKLEDKKK